jgi:hypothetical protein
LHRFTATTTSTNSNLIHHPTRPLFSIPTQKKTSLFLFQFKFHFHHYCNSQDDDKLKKKIQQQKKLTPNFWQYYATRLWGIYQRILITSWNWTSRIIVRSGITWDPLMMNWIDDDDDGEGASPVVAAVEVGRMMNEADGDIPSLIWYCIFLMA